MSECRFSSATGVVSPKRGLWNRNTNNISQLVSGITTKQLVKSNVCLDDQAEQEMSLNEVLDQLESLARPETRPAVQYLKEWISRIEGCKTIKCTLNRILLKARIELHAENKHTDDLNFRATNALHLSGTELQTSKNLGFEATIVEDGVVLTEITGLSVRVLVLKGTSRCRVLQALIQSKGERCNLRVKIRNPLIGQMTDDSSLVHLETDLSSNSNHENDAKKAEQRLEKRQKAKHLRTTYTGMKAFVSLSDIVSPPTPLHLEYSKKLLMIYAVSLVFIASYLYLVSKVPYSVPIVMLLSAVSLFILGFEQNWTIKAKLAILLNALSLMVVIFKMYLAS